MYLEVKIPCPEEVQEVLIAELLASEFESFSQTENSVSAYVNEDLFDERVLEKILSKHLDTSYKNFEVSILEEKNWNEEWEKNFDPVIVEDNIIVKASFHDVNQKYPYEILINPQMSFGTGHHETTWLMLKTMLGIDHKSKRVLDAGTGTGILAIMAAKLGAKSITATDIDEWSINNSVQNFELNGLNEIELKEGGIEELDLEGKFDIIIANINRNVLLHDIPFYVDLLEENGILMLSGFYDKDISTITVACERHHLNSKNCYLKNNWACLTFQKTS